MVLATVLATAIIGITAIPASGSGDCCGRSINGDQCLLHAIAFPLSKVGYDVPHAGIAIGATMAGVIHAHGRERRS